MYLHVCEVQVPSFRPINERFDRHSVYEYRRLCKDVPDFGGTYTALRPVSGIIPGNAMKMVSATSEQVTRSHITQHDLVFSYSAQA